MPKLLADRRRRRPRGDVDDVDPWAGVWCEERTGRHDTVTLTPPVSEKTLPVRLRDTAPGAEEGEAKRRFDRRGLRRAHSVARLRCPGQGQDAKNQPVHQGGVSPLWRRGAGRLSPRPLSRGLPPFV